MCVDSEDERLQFVELLERIADASEEIALRLRVADEGALERALASYFSSPGELQAYRYSDGKRSSREIAQLAGVSHVTVVGYWKRWSEEGLAQPSDAYRGRYRRSYSLSRLLDMQLAAGGPPSPHQRGAISDVQ